MIQEQRSGQAPFEGFRPQCLTIRADGSSCDITDRNHSFLPALASQADKPLTLIEITEVDPDRFTDSSAGGIQCFKQGAIAQGERGPALRKFHQGSGVVFGQNAWKRFGQFGAPDIIRRILRYRSFTQKKSVETPYGSQLSRQGRGFLTFSIQLVEVRPDIFSRNMVYLDRMESVACSRKKRC
jgi:hypothetical protein